jgi:hypothetical protein
VPTIQLEYSLKLYPIKREISPQEESRPSNNPTSLTSSSSSSSSRTLSFTPTAFELKKSEIPSSLQVEMNRGDADDESEDIIRSPKNTIEIFNSEFCVDYSKRFSFSISFDIQNFDFLINAEELFKEESNKVYLIIYYISNTILIYYHYLSLLLLLLLLLILLNQSSK